TPAGIPSRMAMMAGPWDSPAVKKRKDKAAPPYGGMSSRWPARAAPEPSWRTPHAFGRASACRAQRVWRRGQRLVAGIRLVLKVDLPGLLTPRSRNWRFPGDRHAALAKPGPVAGAQAVEIRGHLVIDGEGGQADAVDAPGAAAETQRP